MSINQFLKILIIVFSIIKKSQKSTFGLFFIVYGNFAMKLVEQLSFQSSTMNFPILYIMNFVMINHWHYLTFSFI